MVLPLVLRLAGRHPRTQTLAAHLLVRLLGLVREPQLGLAVLRHRVRLHLRHSRREKGFSS